MKKQFISRIFAISVCLTLLTGCTAVKGLERDLQVILESGGEYYGCYTVNIFNNAVVPQPEPPAGETFIGWAVKEDGVQPGAIPISENKELIRYNDVMGYAGKHRLSVTLSALFEPIPERDLVIAWYAKTGTSGLNQEIMDGFQAKLFDYLTAQGCKPEEMDILLRGYDGNVGDTCAAIRKDSDVDIMVGWSDSGNLMEKGSFVQGEDFLENVGDVTIGEKARYAARKTDTDLSLLVYAWIQDEYGLGAGAAVSAPEPAAQEAPAEVRVPDPGEVAGQSLVIAWYAKSDTSGLDQAAMDAFQARLYEELSSRGYDPQALTITLRGYEGSVGDSCAAIQADGDVDIMLGWSNSENLLEKGGFAEGTDFLENVDGVTVGSKARYLARKTDSALCQYIYAWMQREYKGA